VTFGVGFIFFLEGARGSRDGEGEGLRFLPLASSREEDEILWCAALKGNRLTLCSGLGFACLPAYTSACVWGRQRQCQSLGTEQRWHEQDTHPHVRSYNSSTQPCRTLYILRCQSPSSCPAARIQRLSCRARRAMLLEANRIPCLAPSLGLECNCPIWQFCQFYRSLGTAPLMFTCYRRAMGCPKRKPAGGFAGAGGEVVTW